jgi:hypothetical protein
MEHIVAAHGSIVAAGGNGSSLRRITHKPGQMDQAPIRPASLEMNNIVRLGESQSGSWQVPRQEASL